MVCGLRVAAVRLVHPHLTARAHVVEVLLRVRVRPGRDPRGGVDGGAQAAIGAVAPLGQQCDGVLAGTACRVE